MTARPLDRIGALGRVARDPLTHFVVGGAMLFLGYGWFGDLAPAAPETIRIDRYEVQRLSALFHAQWRRPPDHDELAALLSDRVREEVFYREALALNLDENDVLVRRRLADKLEMALVDVAALEEPDEATLREYHAEHHTRYRTPVEIDLTHRFWSSEGGADEAEAAARAALPLLQAGEPIDDDSFHVAKTQRSLTEDRLLRVFGDEFHDVVTEKAGTPESGRVWFGPVPSAWGVHLVRVDDVVPARPQTLTEVRERVVEDWRRDYVDAEEERRYQELLSRYEIEIDVTDGTRPGEPGLRTTP